MTEQRSKYRLFSTENLVQFAGLIISFLVIHAIYVLLIRPEGEKVVQRNRVMAKQNVGGEGFVPERNFYVILKNYEQEGCLVLLSWAMVIILYKLVIVYREKRVMDDTYIDIEKGERIIPEEALSHFKHLESRMQEAPGLREKLLPKVVLTALHRFHSTHSIQEVSQSVREISDSEADRLDSDLSLVRYIAWAIPSVGFIGTVRGIGEALTKADQAIRGDIQGVTESLGLAFNSTFIALILSIILMYFIHLLQSRQESLILDVEDYCRESLVEVMKIPAQEEDALTLIKKEWT
jgi:biopolymer transport protein ExbB/TolQ